MASHSSYSFYVRYAERRICLTDLYGWLSHNGLCLNLAKSDAVLFGTQQRLRAFPHIASINIAGSVIHLSDTVTTLGVNLDQTLKVESTATRQ